MFKDTFLRLKYFFKAIKSPLFWVMTMELVSFGFMFVPHLILLAGFAIKAPFISKISESDLERIKYRTRLIYLLIGSTLLLSIFMNQDNIIYISLIIIFLFFFNFGGHMLSKVHEKAKDIEYERHGLNQE